MSTLKTGDEHIRFDGMPTGYLLSDFWRWSSSDLLDNTLRGTFSEFIVGTALDLDLSTGFENWLPWDLTYPFQWQDSLGQTYDEVRIEVKSASYIQPWEQKKLSNIIFSIRPTVKWEPDGLRSGQRQRQSDVYVFCLYAETNRRTADPLILDGWEFYIVPTWKLDEICGPQKTISLNSLRQLDPIRADYSGIQAAIVQCVQGDECTPPPGVLYSFCAFRHVILVYYYKAAHDSRAALFATYFRFFWRSDHEETS